MRLVIFLVTLLFCCSSIALAQDQAKSLCSCNYSADPIEALEDFDPVFVGTVDNMSVDTTGSFVENVDMTVIRSFGDTEIPALSKFRVITTGSCAGCRYCGFEENKAFLVYVYRQAYEDFDLPVVSLCSKTAPLEQAHSDLEAYGALDLVEPKSKSRCGGPDNVAMLQGVALTLLLVLAFRPSAEAV